MNMDRMSRVFLFIEHNLTEEKLVQLYGIEQGKHLWIKFENYNRNLLKFINYLGETRRKIFMDQKNNDILFTQTQF